MEGGGKLPETLHPLPWPYLQGTIVPYSSTQQSSEPLYWPHCFPSGKSRPGTYYHNRDSSGQHWRGTGFTDSATGLIIKQPSVVVRNPGSCQIAWFCFWLCPLVPSPVEQSSTNVTGLWRAFSESTSAKWLGNRVSAPKTSAVCYSWSFTIRAAETLLSTTSRNRLRSLCKRLAQGFCVSSPVSLQQVNPILP